MIYCVEDDASIRELTVYALNASGFSALGLECAEALWQQLGKEQPELILLDIMLPDEDGISILKKLRAAPATAEIPVILATAKGTEFDKVLGLDLGADDYLAKPFGMMEMVSRVKAVLRRVSHTAPSQVLTHKNITLNESSHQVFVDGNQIELTIKEYLLLRLFLKIPGGLYPGESPFLRVGERIPGRDSNGGCPYRLPAHQAGQRRRVHQNRAGRGLSDGGCQMTKRIYKAICAAALGVFVVTMLLIMGVLYNYFSSVQQNQLRSETALAVRGAEGMGMAYFDGLNPSDYRVTWIAANGKVLYDSASDTEAMENHLQRQEIQDALATGYGESARYSPTMMKQYLYAAQRLSDGTVLRLSISHNSILCCWWECSSPSAL